LGTDAALGSSGRHLALERQLSLETTGSSTSRVVTEYQRNTLTCLVSGAETSEEWPEEIPKVALRTHAMIGYLGGRFLSLRYTYLMRTPVRQTGIFLPGSTSSLHLAPW